jgi:hypothetical protein
METVITWFSGLLTPVIGVLAVYIAWQQHKLNKISVNKTLFDIRKEVYDHFVAFRDRAISELACRTDGPLSPDFSPLANRDDVITPAELPPEDQPEARSADFTAADVNRDGKLTLVEAANWNKNGDEILHEFNRQ